MLIGTRINTCLQLPLPGRFYTSAATGKRLQSATGKGVEAAPGSPTHSTKKHYERKDIARVEDKLSICDIAN